MAEIVRALTTAAVRHQLKQDVARKRKGNSQKYRDRWADYELPRGQRQAKARGILRYRMVRVPGRPDRLIRVAITKRRGPRGGRTVATSKLEAK